MSRKAQAKKFWQFRNAANDPSIGELYLYGEISDATWWGDEVTPKQFIEDLKSLGDIKTLNVYINSYGGDVFAAHAIHSQLKRHKAKVNVYIDGVAASAASIIAMAGDTIYMPANAMMMVHHPLSGMLGYFYARELRQIADELDKIAESIIAAYMEKTTLDREAILEVMNGDDGEGTWMTAQEAVDLGFADEIEERKNVAASLIGNILNVNGMELDISKFKNFPRDKFRAVAQHQAQTHSKPVEVKNQKKEDKPMEIKNTDDLRKAYPELVAQVEAEAREAGAQEERERIKAIEEIANNIDPALVKKAKFEEPKDAKELAFEALKADRMKAKNYLEEVKEDSVTSGVNDIGAAPVEAQAGEEKPKSFEDKFKTIAARLDAKRRGFKVE